MDSKNKYSLLVAFFLGSLSVPSILAQTQMASPELATNLLRNLWQREPASALPTGISPAIEIGPIDTLCVRTDTQIKSDQPWVAIDVVAPGGAVIAHSNVSRGAIVRLATAGWADGPYDIRCSTVDSWNRPNTVFLPWFKGDALVAARELIADALKQTSGPDGDHIRMLAEMVRDRMSGKLAPTGPETWQALQPPLMEFRELCLVRSGKVGGVRPSGFVRLAYSDAIDGSTQFCRAYLPAHYDPTKRWPVVIFLHGFNPTNPPYTRWWAVDSRHNEAAESRDVIYLEPHGRGNSQYEGIGEKDVLAALADAKRHFAVDEDRVYLTGESMGGHGTWWIGSRHPDIFAAIAPFFGGWDFRMTPPQAGGFGGRVPANAWERFFYESASSFACAENLLHVPVYVNHGDADHEVSVEFSRFAVHLLERWGYDVRYQEHVGLGHRDLGMRVSIVDWLLTHRRPEAPRTIRLHALNLTGARAYWLQVDAWDHPSDFIDADAEFIRPAVLRLDTRNVAALTLSPPKALTNGDVLTVVWNGRQTQVTLVHGQAHLTSADYVSGTANKRRGLEGPISDIVTTPFVVVIGTISNDPQMREVCRVKGEAFERAWLRWQHCRPRVRLDRDLTESELHGCSLILIGGADANSVARTLRGQLPLHVDDKSVTIGDRTWNVTDAVASMIHPSPVAPGRYVLEVAATSAVGLSFWNPILWNEPLGYPTVLFDWSIQDNRRVSLPPGRPTSEALVAYGVFDRSWERKEADTMQGDQKLRSESPVRHGPLTGAALAQVDLSRYIGTYELFPGFALKLFVQDRNLYYQAPGADAARLVPESDTEFGIPDNGGQLRFQLGSNNGVLGVIANQGGQEIPFHKIQGNQ